MPRRFFQASRFVSGQLYRSRRRTAAAPHEIRLIVDEEALSIRGELYKAKTIGCGARIPLRTVASVDPVGSASGAPSRFSMANSASATPSVTAASAYAPLLLDGRYRDPHLQRFVVVADFRAYLYAAPVRGELPVCSQIRIGGGGSSTSRYMPDHIPPNMPELQHPIPWTRTVMLFSPS